MKFTINYEDALKLQKSISKTKGALKEIRDITVRVRKDGRTDLFATDGFVMGAFFTKEEVNQEEMGLDIYDHEKIFTIDFRTIGQVKKKISGNEYLACELKDDLLRIKLNVLGEEIKLATDKNNHFDKFEDILSYDNYTSEFNGETIVDTELLDRVAFGKVIVIRKSTDDDTRFLVTAPESSYRGVILGKTTIEDEELPEETQEGSLFDQDLEDLAEAQVAKNKIVKKILTKDIVPEGMKVSIEHNGNETIIGDKTNG